MHKNDESRKGLDQCKPDYFCSFDDMIHKRADVFRYS